MFTARSKWLPAVAVALSATLLASCGDGDGASEGSDGSQVLKFTYVTTEDSPHGQVLSWWLDEVEARTDGAITFERYWNATLLKADEMVEGLADGRIDIAQIQPTSYGAKEFIATNVAEVPFVSPNFPAVSAAMAELAQDPEGEIGAEWSEKSMVPLSWQITAGGMLSSTEPVQGVDDLKGLRLRATGRLGQVLTAVDANPIQLAAGEIYGSLDRGLIDGVFGVPFSYAGPLKFPEVAKYYTATGSGVSTANALAMSVERWESLTQEQRDIMLEVSAEVPAKLAEIEPIFNASSCEAIKEAGGTTSVFSDAEVKKFADISAGLVEDGWISDANDGGVDGSGLLSDYRQAVSSAVESQFPTFEPPEASCVTD